MMYVGGSIENFNYWLCTFAARQMPSWRAQGFYIFPVRQIVLDSFSSYSCYCYIGAGIA
jgi:hypothetical protein